ncbi:MAG: BTAD domain-containing putative transcriptional regulator [Pirellulales bacterium]
MLASLITWSCLAGLSVCGQSVADEAPQPALQKAPAVPVTAEQLEKWIEQLADDRIAVRDAATQQLWEAGVAAEAALKRAATSTDAEVRLRARSVLDKFKFGLFPDTPADTVALINQFRNGTVERRSIVMQKLAEKREFETLFRLVNSVTDPAQRQQLLQRVQVDANSVIRQLVVQGNLAEAERILEFGSDDDAGMLALAAFCDAAGTLDQRVKHAQEKFAAQASTANARSLVYLLRAKGDLATAYDAARRAEDAPLQRAILFEAGRWAELLEVQTSSGVQPPQKLMTAGPQGNAVQDRVEQLGYRLAAARRAGNDAEVAAALDELKQFAEDQRDAPAITWSVSEALLINGVIDPGIERMKTAQPRSAFELLAYQHRYGEAFAFVGVKEGREFNSEWLDALPASAGAASMQRIQRFQLAAAVARVLHLLGKKQEAAQVVALLDRVAQDAASKDRQSGGRADLMLTLAQLELRLGMLEPAFAHADQASSEADVNAQILRMLFGTRSEEASAWLLLFRQQDSSLSLAKALPRIYRMLQFPVPADSNEEEYAKWVEPALALAQTLTQSDQRGKFLDGLAVSMLTRNYQSPARKLLEAAAPQFAPSAMRLADLEAEHDRWAEAARWYETAAKIDAQLVAAFCLHGLALDRAGQKELGRQIMQQSKLIALTGRSRHAIGQQLHARGHMAEAAEMLEFAMRTSPFEHWETNDCARLLGDIYAAERPADAARLWDRHMLADLRVVYNFIDVDSYVRFPFIIHKARAQAAITAGQFESAQREIDAAAAASPNDVRLAEDLTPLLLAAGRREQADQLFEKTYASLSSVIDVYPESAFHRNNLAWMAARCHRRLDKALEHAQEAVRLQPDNPSYIDTLAEVHFHRGNREEAIRFEESAVKLSPRVKTYQTQLETFRSKPLPQ